MSFVDLWVTVTYQIDSKMIDGGGSIVVIYYEFF